MIKSSEVIEYSETFWESEGFKGNSSCWENLKSYLENYPKKNKLFVIAEKDYIDKNYLIDYVNYYSRCFEDVGRKTTRFHFFEAKSKEEICSLFSKMLTTGDCAQHCKKINEQYLGFIVKKPNNNGVVGRTILKKYPEIDKNGDRRILNVFRENKVNLFGVSLSLDSLPFQEQDGAVSACATVAIWTALQSLGRKFEVSVPLAPSEITDMAFSSGALVDSKKFPNEGLTTYQIINSFRDLGYEVYPYKDLYHYDEDFLSGLIKAFVRYGIPMVALLSLIDKTGRLDGHAVIISGYKCDEKTGAISHLYVHDDQIGPYSKVEFFDSETYLKAKEDLKNNYHYKIENPLCLWRNEWTSRNGMKYIILDQLLIPLYPKIRMSYARIAKFVRILRAEDFVTENSQVDCFLADNNSYKKSIVEDLIPTFQYREDGIKILRSQLPRFFWVVRFMAPHELCFDQLFDATKSDPHSRPIHEIFLYNEY